MESTETGEDMLGMNAPLSVLRAAKWPHFQVKALLS
jgi:hypothetical protein